MSETRAVNSRKNEDDQGMKVPHLSEILLVSLHCLFFWKIASELLSFHGFFTSKRTFDHYLVWKACTQFQKIWSWRRYKCPKFVKNALIFLVTLHPFCFKKVASKMQFFLGFFISKRTFGGDFGWNVFTHFQNIFSWTRYDYSDLETKTQITFVALLRFLLSKISIKNVEFWGSFPLKNLCWQLLFNFTTNCQKGSKLMIF